MSGKLMRGVVTAAVTPFSKDGALDLAQVDPIVDHLVRVGVDAVFAGGSTGSFTLMTSQERKQVAEAYIKAVDGRMPVGVHVGAHSEVEAIDLARHAGAAGADSLVAVPPYYFKYDASSLIGFFKRLAAVNPELPLYVYNIPMYTGNDLTPAILKKMRQEVPNLAGVKDTTQDYTRYLDYVDALGPDFGVLMGSDAMCLGAIIAGGAGAISAVAAHNPELILAIFRLWAKGEQAKAQRLQFLAARLRLIFQKLPFFSPRVAIMRLRGIAPLFPRQPMRDLTREEEQLLVETLQGWEQEFDFPLLNRV